MTVDLEKLRAKAYAAMHGKTHWDGCAQDHWCCAVVMLLDRETVTSGVAASALIKEGEHRGKTVADMAWAEVDALRKALAKERGWIWQPHAGHLVVADRCRFRMNTVVADGKYIVSTVGEYVLPHEKKGKYTAIGCDRLYETMVFAARHSASGCCEYEAMSFVELDMAGYNDASEARLGHLAICNKWGAK